MSQHQLYGVFVCFVTGEDEDETQAVDLLDEPDVKRSRLEITGVHGV